ncbi:MAG: hypothetical protein AAF849_23940 [Bacteroidota bacterium]
MQLPKIFDSISSFRQEEGLPQFDSLSQYIEYIVPSIRPFGEDLYETENYVGASWLEFSDDETDEAYKKTVVHYFNEGREYMRSVNGDITRGSWELKEGENRIVLDTRQRGTELYDLTFLHPYFFILRKHGTREYFVLGREQKTRSLTWREYAEALDQVYENNNTVLIIVTVLVFMIVALFFLLR